jgi:hypothetical protein
MKEVNYTHRLMIGITEITVTNHDDALLNPQASSRAQFCNHLIHLTTGTPNRDVPE